MPQFVLKNVHMWKKSDLGFLIELMLQQFLMGPVSATCPIEWGFSSDWLENIVDNLGIIRASLQDSLCNQCSNMFYNF